MRSYIANNAFGKRTLGLDAQTEKCFKNTSETIGILQLIYLQLLLLIKL